MIRETENDPSCCICKTSIGPDDARYEVDPDLILCGPCRDAAPGHEPRKIAEAYFAQFAEEAGGPEDERDHEDFRIGEYLVTDGRIPDYLGPFGRIIEKSASRDEQ